MRDDSVIHAHLAKLGLSKDERAIFLTLLQKPQTQLDISRDTGIARSSVYRIVDGMMEKGLVSELATDEGKLLTSAHPDALELLVIEQEAAAQAQRASLQAVLPLLGNLFEQQDEFTIKTYSGAGGVKQMLWNELRSKTEIVLFSGENLNMAAGKRWAEKYRQEVIARGLQIRGIEHVQAGAEPPSALDAYTRHYRLRYIPKEVLDIRFEISVHDNTVSIYNSLAGDVRLGSEITNPFLAVFMRQVFELYWSLAKDAKDI